jgi:hypothetical protein
MRLVQTLTAACLVFAGAMIPAATLTAREAAPAAKPANLTTVLGLKAPSAFRFDPKYGMYVGSEDTALLVNADKISTLDIGKTGATVVGTQAASTFKVMAPAAITPAFLKQNFPTVFDNPRGTLVIRDILASQRASALFSPGKGRALYVATRTGLVYYIDFSPVDAPSFTRLVPMAMPKMNAIKKPDAKAVDTYINALPPCSEGKFPCQN